MALTQRTTAKVNEWVKWYNWHCTSIGAQPLEQQVKWLLKAVGGAYEIMSMIGNEVNTGSSRARLNLSEGGIALPQGYQWDRRP